MTNPLKLSPEERRTGTILAAIFGLRMFGLFIILPVFALHARQLPAGDNLALVGMALGAFGLVQACLQIPYGIASDCFGRKRLIIIGLLLFAAGSLWGTLAHDVWQLAGARALQGAGAISAVVTALAADLTRPTHITRVMAMIGSSVALVFALSLVLSPLLYGWVGMAGIFLITALLVLPALFFLTRLPPEPPRHSDPKPPFWRVLRQGNLVPLNLGIFFLSVIQTALFVTLPRLIADEAGLAASEHWKLYLPAVLLSFVVMVPAIIAAEKHGKMAPIFRGAILLIAFIGLGLSTLTHSLWLLALALLLFFIAFNILEATLPSLVARQAPGAAKGTAMGIYNTAQSSGMFCGGLLGGALAQYLGDNAVFLMCIILSLLWLIITTRQVFIPRTTAKASTNPTNPTNPNPSTKPTL